MARRIIGKTRTPEARLASSVRRHTFDEVTAGYSEADAVSEASRCILCRNTPCLAGCPAGIDIPTFIRQVSERAFDDALATITAANPMPSITGRVCPHDKQCECRCTLGVRFDPIAIGRLERFVADRAASRGRTVPAPAGEPTGRRVAIVGSGPAGLGAAAELVARGHDVTVFEARSEVGGVLAVGIPDFRLPRAVVRHEIQSLEARGVEFKTNHIIGRTFTLDELTAKLGFDAVFIATGVGWPVIPELPGTDLTGVHAAADFLEQTRPMRPYRPELPEPPIVRGRVVAVIGGGDTAVDAARTAVRLGAERVRLVYRRGEPQMPARRDDVALAREEGVEIVLLAAPVALLGDQQGRVRRLRLARMELGAPDGSGRAASRPVAGREFELEADVVVFAVGQRPSPLLASTTPDLHVDLRGTICADGATGATEKKGVFAGGDVVTGGATVSAAMAAGRRAALAIDTYLNSPLPDGC